MRRGGNFDDALHSMTPYKRDSAETATLAPTTDGIEIRLSDPDALDRIACAIGLAREVGEDDETLTSRCHYQIDAHIRAHAARRGDSATIAYMDLHQAIGECVPVTDA